MEQIFIVKIGGNVIDDENNLSTFLKILLQLRVRKF
jgi:acetylglutamate kinase